MATNAELLARRNKAVARGIAHATPVYAARAENAELWDADGKRYIDFAGGIAVLNTGHRHPKVMAAVREQLERYTHTAFQVIAYEPYIALAERLNKLAPFKGPAKTVLFTTGAEAVENAVKIARVATGRSGIITFTGAFHGRTLLTMAMTGKVQPYKKSFGAMPGEIYHLPFPVAHHGVGVEDSLKALQFLFKADIEPQRVAAIVIEPVQGEGGFYVTPTELLTALRKVCDEHGILLISDEVQAGFARTGKMFGIEHSGVEPDLIAIAKSLAGGLPLSGVIGRAAIMDAAEPGGLGGTYGGNPLACVAALAVLDVIEEEKLLARAEAMGKRIKATLEKMSRQNDLLPIAAIRGPGAMIGFEIVKERGGFDPDPDATRRLTTRALELGLVVLSCGVYNNVIRILVPLTASDAIVDEGMKLLEQAMKVAA
ncbi:MAG: 4-aminobutyrate aminotransferase / (S)-3-amino-2-methylpropionate transaminase / 5-aminovalerate [Rhodospirillaceae bacterium]|nr:4-aminobutyrate aminotransferase / (S)-3-amino-2-methylpropionate transaminase / 5-aminovalerate [Rhodospirillaceae bacterium]